MKNTFLLLLFFTLAHAFVVNAESSVDDLLKELDQAIEQRDEYLEKKQEGIANIKKQLVPGESKSALLVRYSVSVQLYEEYKSFIYDSAFYYSRVMLQTAYKLNDSSIINDAKIKVSFTLLSTGMFKEALDTLHSVDTSYLSKDAKIEYYSVFARTYYDLGDYSNDLYFSEHYKKKGAFYLDQALALCDPNSTRFLLLKGMGHMTSQDIGKAISTFEQALQNPKLTEHDKAIASSSLGFMYGLNGKPDKAKAFLARAAIADITSSIRETVAIRDLAAILYDEGKVERAYKYVKVALDDAYFYGARHRKIQIANVLPIIEGAQLEILENQKKDLFFYLVTAMVLAGFIVIFAVIIFRQNRKLGKAKTELTESHQDLEKTNKELARANAKMSEINNTLQDANKIKEEYIGSFFKIISDNLEKIEKFKNTLDRKFINNKIEDVRDLVRNLNLKPEREQLYLTFDQTFLKIFPGFVDQFNSFFNKEDQFNIDEKQGLPTELRIFALIRLGIDDTERIARILDYSVNTIYAYKTRMKNKSILDNEKFEEELMKIRAI